MKKLHQVEEARALMEWSVFHWLFEKRLVRETADQANAALDKLNRSLKTRWSGEAKAAFKELSGRTNGAATLPQIKSALPTVNPKSHSCSRRSRKRMTRPAAPGLTPRIPSTKRKGC